MKTGFSDHFYLQLIQTALISTVKVRLSARVKNNVKWLLCFFVLFVQNDLGLFSPPTFPRACSGFLSVYMFLFLLYHLMFSDHITVFVYPARLLPVKHTVNSYFDQTTSLSLNSYCKLPVWPQFSLQGPIFCINSQNYKFPKWWCVSGLLVNSPEIKVQMEKINFTSFAFPVFQMNYDTDRGYMLRVVLWKSVLLALDCYHPTQVGKTNRRSMKYGDLLFLRNCWKICNGQCRWTISFISSHSAQLRTLLLVMRPVWSCIFLQVNKC